jgi:hypothetical protein
MDADLRNAKAGPRLLFRLGGKTMAETDKDKLKKMTAWDTAPALTDGEIDALLAAVSLVDKDGIAPEALGWVPTYDLNAAAAQGWLIKAGRASELVEVDPPGSGLFASKVFDNCRTMARIYRAKCSGSVSV